MADLKMKLRADRVAGVIQAPTLKDTAADAMIKAAALDYTEKAMREEEVRQYKIKESSQENLIRHQLQQIEQRKNNYELQSPGRRQYPSQYATTAEE